MGKQGSSKTEWKKQKKKNSFPQVMEEKKVLFKPSGSSERPRRTCWWARERQSRCVCSNVRNVFCFVRSVRRSLLSVTASPPSYDHHTIHPISLSHPTSHIPHRNYRLSHGPWAMSAWMRGWMRERERAMRGLINDSSTNHRWVIPESSMNPPWYKTSVYDMYE